MKKVWLGAEEDWVGELVTLDMNPNCGAGLVLDMGAIVECRKGLPFGDEEFDEIAAYDALEHWGNQGDWRAWFYEMGEYHRILKAGGSMGIIVPIGADALSDPGHIRFFGPNHFYMLNQQWYVDQLEKALPVTDYRWTWKRNFEVAHMLNHDGHHLSVMLKKA